MATNWQVEFYETRRGDCPVEAYLDSLPVRERKAALQVLNMLRDQGPALRMPYARHIEGPLWELRASATRLFYAAWVGCAFVVLHACKKQGQKARKKEIELAFRRLGEIERRG